MWSSLRSGTANWATTSTSETPMGSLWSSTPPTTVSRLPWMNCAAANSPTKSYWTGRSNWDWGCTSHGGSYDSFGDLAGSETQQPTTATTAAPAHSRGARYSQSLLSGRRSTGLAAKEPIQEPTWTAFRRHPATPGDCQAWSGAPPSMRRRTPYPAGWKPALSQNGRDNGLAVSKSTEIVW